MTISRSNPVVRRIKRIAREERASPMEEKAAMATGIVETHMQNLPGGDADSAGWRQERRSIYRDPTNLDASIRRFFRETRALRGKYNRAGDLAAAVQRPAARYRGRYEQVSRQADALMDGHGPVQTRAPTRRTTTLPGVDNSALRGQLVAQFLQQKGADPLDFALGVRAAQDVPGQTETVTTMGPKTPSSSNYGARAEAIDKQRLPYKWGGGHAGKVNPNKTQPLDCSGAVSAVLGINPRVSGDLMSFGKPGKGKHVTIYANGHHTLLEVDGHFWGTSASNPGGGAGWIKRELISPQYLKGFTVRHPPGE